MSYDMWVEHISKTYTDDDGDVQPVRLAESINYTSNVAGMWRDALGGVSLGDFDGAPCVEAGGPLAVAALRMEADPAKYKAMNPENGWGDYEGARVYLRTLADWCQIYSPIGKLVVWR